MCDLAFEFGCTPSELSARLSLSDFALLQEYADHKCLPHQRTELMLAQLTALVARTMGGDNTAKAQDYLIYRRETVDQPEPDAEEVAAYFGFNPVAWQTN